MPGVFALVVLIAVVARGASRDEAASWRERAVASLRDDRLRAAHQTALQVVERWPADCRALHLAGVLSERLRPGLGSASFLEDAIRLCPDDPAILYDTGRALHSRGCGAAALALVHRASLLAPADRHAAGVVEQMRRQSRREWSAVDLQIATLGDSIAGRSNPNAANDERRRLDDPRHRLMHLLEIRLASSPRDQEVMIRLAELHRLGIELGDPSSRSRALALVEAALHYRPGWSVALQLLGTLHLTDEPSRPDLAERAFLEAIGANGGVANPAAWSGLFFVYASTGRETEAADAARQYLRLEPADENFRELSRGAKASTPAGGVVGSQGFEP